ncbi:DUF262 domain-containing protein [Planomonospora sp. ID91781]|uniref:DUF262 domain-containing protein n=1 Tax=Planomonospora sp. ID91781 TaxID=2738135 RepID=UPI0018C41FBE|nr:DUF262 domain-containing protein [Planomonospora sp. ID91781]MBG0825182.1 DUF262 domain-containing protein [Planomonospora sp. ID91781]
MQARPITLRKLIKGEPQYVVPIYQRPYSWEQDKLDRLWRDITRQACSLGEGGQAGHFLGSIVLAPAPELMPGDEQWVIVDGQQRLTTLLLALCAIRDHRAEEEDLGHRSRMNNGFLINKEQSGERRYRLRPTRMDRQAFQSCVEGAIEDADGNIGAAYRFLRGKLAVFEGLTSPDDVRHVETVILDRLDLVQIVVDKEDNAFQIFESINNTGMRLSPVDFIRNYVFMCLPERGAEVYENQWLPTQRLLGLKEFDRLMHVVHVLNHGEQAERLDVYRGHQEMLEEFRDDEEKVEDYVRSLARRGRYLDRILKADERTEIGSSIAFLKEFKPATVYPVIMRLLELHDEGHAADEEVARALRYVESFVVRRFVGQVAMPSLTRVLHRLAVTLTPDQPVDHTVRDELSPVRWGWPSDADFRRDIAAKDFYRYGTHAQRKAVLRRLEEDHPFRERTDLSVKEISIEHVLPQSPTQDWLDGLVLEGDARSAHRRLVHTLGNLTLTGYNSELSNAPFVEKRVILGRSAIAMNHVIAECERWGEAEILARAADLAERAVRIWPGPDESEQVRGVVPDWSPLTRALAALPPAKWISYGDLARLVGSHVLAVRVYLGNADLPNGDRVLTADGEPPAEGRMVSRAELRQAMAPLQSRGITLDELGRAKAEHRITGGELAALLGWEEPEAPDGTGPVRGEHQRIDDKQRRFLGQLGVEAGPRAAGAVQRLLEHWSAGGGEIQYGAGGASCAAALKRGRDRFAALRIYPKKVEVSFGTFMTRRPFDDTAVREEMRERLNDIPGVEVPVTKLDGYPSFPVTVLASESAWDVVVACLDWFRDVATREA